MFFAPAVSCRRPRESRSAMPCGGRAFSNGAAISMARGSPSRRVQISAIVRALWWSSMKRGWTARALPTNSANAQEAGRRSVPGGRGGSGAGGRARGEPRRRGAGGGPGPRVSDRRETDEGDAVSKVLVEARSSFQGQPRLADSWGAGECQQAGVGGEEVFADRRKFTIAPEEPSWACR